MHLSSHSFHVKLRGEAFILTCVGTLQISIRIFEGPAGALAVDDAAAVGSGRSRASGQGVSDAASSWVAAPAARITGAGRA